MLLLKKCISLVWPYHIFGHCTPNSLANLVVEVGTRHIHQILFTDGFEMMHKASRSLEEVSYCFRGLPSNLNRRFKFNLIKITPPDAAIKSLKYALFFTNARYVSINKQNWQLWTGVIQIAVALITRGFAFFQCKWNIWTSFRLTTPTPENGCKNVASRKLGRQREQRLKNTFRVMSA